jgi:uridine phosphorylase
MSTPLHGAASHVHAGMTIWRFWCIDSLMPPILDNKNPNAASIFQPAALLREARRQKGLGFVEVPRMCILDPDGDVVRRLRREGKAHRFAGWPCYHSELDEFMLAGQTIGIVGCAVGAPFAVLVAEQLLACGCRFLVSLTSAGQIVPAGRPPYFVIIDRALRDEGTSYHYVAPCDYAEADAALVEMARAALREKNIPCMVGASWTTDAPFRETADAVAWARSKDVLAVEMEAAALYAFARAAGMHVLCLAAITNVMGQIENDFEKGDLDGAADALALLEAIALRAVERLS